MKDKLTYIDVFSGCGGFSLGLGKAGFSGVFAIEKDVMAFETFCANLVDSEEGHFNWPEWLPKKAMTIQTLLKNYKEQLATISGKVDVIVGGPPCQGFSLAGRRNSEDPRNKLSNEYLKLVEVIKPKYILLENVKGFNTVFVNGTGRNAKIPQSLIVKGKLEKLGYHVSNSLISSADFGVPQSRERFVMVGVLNGGESKKELEPFEMLNMLRKDFLVSKKLPLKPISVYQAIGDLEVNKNEITYHSGSEVSGFKQIRYTPPRRLTAYQKIMRGSEPNNLPNSLRLARHKPTTIDKFKKIQEICRPGCALNDREKEIIGTKKQAITVLDKNKPSKTLTTLPDDLIHYAEPRILTVRESARIQSFPDSFKFLGKYTTGGDRRKHECPRYTQVGNAVPPLLGEALGNMLLKIQREIN